jgi:hypothetical protein
MVTVPITYLDAAGAPAPKADGTPCIRVKYSFERGSIDESGRVKVDGLQECWARIAWGGEGSRIRTSVLPEEIRKRFSVGPQDVSLTLLLGQSEILGRSGRAAVIQASLWEPIEQVPYDLELSREFFASSELSIEGTALRFVPNPRNPSDFDQSDFER